MIAALWILAAFTVLVLALAGIGIAVSRRQLGVGDDE